jgi:hypothetical protein
MHAFGSDPRNYLVAFVFALDRDPGQPMCRKIRRKEVRTYSSVPGMFSICFTCFATNYCRHFPTRVYAEKFNNFDSPIPMGFNKTGYREKIRIAVLGMAFPGDRPPQS